MGLFGNRNDKIKEMSKMIKTKRVQCPRCGKRYEVTFLGSNDSKRCVCGYTIYCD